MWILSHTKTTKKLLYSFANDFYNKSKYQIAKKQIAVFKFKNNEISLTYYWYPAQSNSSKK